MVAKKQFVEFFEVHGNFYGTSVLQLEEIKKSGKIPILCLDPYGTEKLLEIYPKANAIFILPPNLEALENRLRERKSESPESFKKRMEDA